VVALAIDQSWKNPGGLLCRQVGRRPGSGLGVGMASPQELQALNKPRPNHGGIDATLGNPAVLLMTSCQDPRLSVPTLRWG